MIYNNNYLDVIIVYAAVVLVEPWGYDEPVAHSAPHAIKPNDINGLQVFLNNLAILHSFSRN